MQTGTLSSPDKTGKDSAPTTAAINLVSCIRIVLILFCTWLAVSAVLIYRVQKLGAFASVGSIKTLEYVKQYTRANPASGRLNQSYSEWALALNGTDASNYIKAGLGFAEGHGVSLKQISPEHPHNNTYFPYYYQAPGAAILIGTTIKLFGERQIFPYFILILFVHFLTALSTCFLASKFVKGEAFILGAGLISLLCLPTLSFNFGLGIFCGEAPAGLFVGTALICLSLFWKHLTENSLSYKLIFITALGCGASLALAAYFRDIYTTFAQFCALILFIYALLKKTKFKQIVAFVVISTVALSALEYPWEKRNQRFFNEFTMTGSTYCGYALWYFIWSDYNGSARWAAKSGHGLGNFLAPEKSAEVLAKLEQNKKAGSLHALQCLIQAIIAKPLDALRFKVDAYQTLWLGQESNQLVYYWCLFSTIIFLVFLYLTRFRFIPELSLFPMYLLFLSPLIHYEHRYSQPFFLFCTPVAIISTLAYFARRMNQSQINSRE